MKKVAHSLLEYYTHTLDHYKKVAENSIVYIQVV